MTLPLALLLCVAVLGTVQGASVPPKHKLLVLSVDGLDWRYLRDRNQLGLKIPNIRQLLKEGRFAQGVVGVFPTITWPSHTSLITGVPPSRHGILGNRRPRSEGGDYYWSVNLLKSPTLWQAAQAQGWTTASITWPVTVDAPITYDLPEYFQRRNGGSMDLESISAKATPGLASDIARAYPSFPQQWMEDRTRTLAVLYLLAQKQPDLMLVHFVDLDSEAHDQGPFTQNANAVLEWTDQLIGQILAALPRDYVFALVSDHGFERVDKTANLPALLKQAGVAGQLRSMGGIAVTDDPKVAKYLREASKNPANGIGREIPDDEVQRHAPELAHMTVFEPAEHVMFGSSDKEPYFTPPFEKGNHGFWPARADYRSIFILRGPGISPEAEPELRLTAIAGRLADVLGLKFP